MISFIEVSLRFRTAVYIKYKHSHSGIISFYNSMQQFITSISMRYILAQKSIISRLGGKQGQTIVLHLIVFFGPPTGHTSYHPSLGSLKLVSGVKQG